MTDHERLIRIDERQVQMAAEQIKIADTIGEIYEQCKMTNGRVKDLENYRENHEVDVAERVKMIIDHDHQLDNIQLRHSELNGSWKTIVWIGSTIGAVAGVAALIFEVIQHTTK